MTASGDSPFPELKKTHTMARTGRPYTDYKPPAAAPVWAAIEGLARYHVLVAALELDVFDTLQRLGPATVEAVNAEIGASLEHLRTLLDSVVVLGLLAGSTWLRTGDIALWLQGQGPAVVQFALDERAPRVLASVVAGAALALAFAIA